MTYGTRRLTIVASHPLAELSSAHLESAWREACCAFLGACFTGATKEHLEFLGRAMFRAREAMDVANRK
jgi:hypothetical protein